MASMGLHVADRRGPSSGYDFGNKRQYRRTVWATFKSELGGHVSRCHALLMPSIEGDEIDVALSKGFREERLHIVDRNPAIVATLKRRYPKVNTYGCDIAVAAERIAKKGILLSAAHLDLCAPMSLALDATIRRFMEAGAIATTSVVAMNMLRGRELGIPIGRFAVRMADWDTADWDISREFFLRDAMGYAGMPNTYVRSGSYRSSAGTQTMKWMIVRFHAGDRWERRDSGRLIRTGAV